MKTLLTNIIREHYLNACIADNMQRMDDDSELSVIIFSLPKNEEEQDNVDAINAKILSQIPLCIANGYEIKSNDSYMHAESEEGNWIRFQITDYYLYLTIFFSGQG